MRATRTRSEIIFSDEMLDRIGEATRDPSHSASAIHNCMRAIDSGAPPKEALMEVILHLSEANGRLHKQLLDIVSRQVPPPREVP